MYLDLREVLGSSRESGDRKLAFDRLLLVRLFGVDIDAIRFGNLSPPECECLCRCEDIDAGKVFDIGSMLVVEGKVPRSS